MSESKKTLDPIEEYFFYVGLLAAYWNKAEAELDDLLSGFIGDEKIAHIIAGETNISKRHAYLKRIIEQCHPEAEWRGVLISALALLYLTYPPAWLGWLS